MALMAIMQTPAAQALGEQMADASGYSLTHPAPGSANAGFKGLVHRPLCPPRLYRRGRAGPKSPAADAAAGDLITEAPPILCLAMTGG